MENLAEAVRRDKKGPDGGDDARDDGTTGALIEMMFMKRIYHKKTGACQVD